MPDITLNLPSNSKFKSSLNEIDAALRAVLLDSMRIADPRNKLGIQDVEADPDKNDWLWDYSRVFQVDDLDVIDIFDTYLLRKEVNSEKGSDITYPLLAFKQNDLDTVFWGKGQRLNQWYFDLPAEESDWAIDDEIVIANFSKYRGLKGTIAEVRNTNSVLYFAVNINGNVLKERNAKGIFEPVWFTKDDLRQIGDKKASKYKAKAITGTYTASILVDTRDEAQYLRDKFILRISDSRIWHKYKSPTLNGSENQIYTVFGIPNLEKYPTSNDKLKGKGYIYGIAFNIDVWGCVTDTPLPAGWIESIRMTIKQEDDARTNRIIIG